MKIIGLALASLACSTVGQRADQFHINSDTILGPSMWVFGDSGLNIFSPDGSQMLKSIPAPEICHNVSGYRGAAPDLSCNFYDVVSDGRKYVWAAVSRGVSKIDVFDLDTGDIAGSFETCMSPRQLEFHPIRDEVWVRCQGHVDGEGYMNAFSASSPSAKSTSKIHFQDNTTLSSYGFTAVDNTLGDVAYSTMWGNNQLFKIDLSTKTVLDVFDIPTVYGTYEIAYSKVNKHLYLRSQVCCTCGFEGSDMGVDCGRYGSSLINVTTGPFAGETNITGQCGRCDGTPADTVGVLEFDTNTDTWVGNHIMKEGIGGDPVVSPDGKWVVMFTRNGGESVRILKPGAPGVKSSVGFDVSMDFNFTGNERMDVFEDFAFIETDDMSVIFFASGTDRKVAIVDISSGTPAVSYIPFGSPESELHRRQVEWIPGTPYVWVEGSNNEILVFDVTSKSLIRTINDVPIRQLLAVENYERLHTAQLLATMANDEATADSALSSGLNAVFGQNLDDDDDDPISAVAISAIILAGIAIVVGVANLVRMSQISVKHQDQMTFMLETFRKEHGDDTPSVAGTGDEVTLGSKQVS